jgi:site-specific DNA-methyltransferase (adenine-specific)
MLDEQSGGVGGDKRKSKSTYDKGIWGNARAVESNALYNDAGGASRFFYCAKSSRSERNMGLEGLNNHPTVKPLKLMEYLCILTKTPKGGVILDPFTGSGTTLIAAKKIGRDFIGIEKEKEYCEIAEARIKAIPKPLF